MTTHHCNDAVCTESATALQATQRISGVTGVILAGNRRLKAGCSTVLHTAMMVCSIRSMHRQLADIFQSVFLVTDSPELFEFLPCRKVPELFAGRGDLAGIHAGLYHSATECIFAVACDMPNLNSGLIRHIVSRGSAGGVLVPEGPFGFEPLHAVYGRGCLAALEVSLLKGEQHIALFFERCNVNKINQAEVAGHDPAFDSFRTITAPNDYFRLRNGAAEAGKTEEHSDEEDIRAVS